MNGLLTATLLAIGGWGGRDLAMPAGVPLLPAIGLAIGTVLLCAAGARARHGRAGRPATERTDPRERLLRLVARKPD
ncbi:MAG: hypothetical protein ABW221_21330 [Vicinamibacteria bacterium]